MLKVALDVTSVDSLDAAFDAALTRFKRVDVVVNNAGYGIQSEIEATPEAEARRIMETLFWGAVHVTQQASVVS